MGLNQSAGRAESLGLLPGGDSQPPLPLCLPCHLPPPAPTCPYHLPCLFPFLPVILVSGDRTQGLPQSPSHHTLPHSLSLPPHPLNAPCPRPLTLLGHFGFQA